MTSAKFPDFLTPSPSPLVTVTLTQLISTVVCFWGTPSPSQRRHHMYMAPLHSLDRPFPFSLLNRMWNL